MVRLLRQRGMTGLIADAARSALRGTASAFVSPIRAVMNGTIHGKGVLYPAVILGYVLGVFSLEYALIASLAPAPNLPARIAAHDVSPEAEAMRDLIGAVYPAALDPLPGPEHFTTRLPLEFPVPWETDDAEPCLAMLSNSPHPLLCTTSRMLPALPRSARVAHGSVSRHIVRLPVDKDAFHPLDKERFLEIASNPEKLRRLFAMVETQMPPLAALENTAETAIAPPVTRLDRIREKIAHRRSLGGLCAMFESGVRGVYAIGYDHKGGTSYGKYQMSSRKGTMRRFVSYLDTRAPSLARRLKRCGPANTGTTDGVMPDEWRRIAGEFPRLFERLQDDFVHNTYYSPTLREIRSRTGIDLDAHPVVLREVLWSTAVQHGPLGSAGIFERAEQRARMRPASEYHRALVVEIFREREARVRNKCHPEQLRPLIQRLRQERTIALSRLQKPVLNTMLTHPTGGNGVI
ncbi:hypothetical protein GGQ74_000387 [Desulfobaculum xiamenense]|uniref:Type VI secretion system spike protein VgrG3-like C-terminal domain-containing protein n=1 Tax=Desulfobaculum xiamenense TaxID=995050 RepID=A0A846QI75_9BACT|nr:hypothetical protein [Desulfobaculum xiamenense]NJB66747.1 hypothetical protein [Desulfobaculum xiamenense]